MTIQVDNALPPNVIEIGNEITQGVVDGLMSATPAPTSVNPFVTEELLNEKLSLGGGTLTGALGVEGSNPQTAYLFEGNLYLHDYEVNSSARLYTGSSLAYLELKSHHEIDGFNYLRTATFNPTGISSNWNDSANDAGWAINEGGASFGFTDNYFSITSSGISYSSNGDLDALKFNSLKVGCESGNNWEFGYSGALFGDGTIQTTAAIAPTFATSTQAQAGTSTTTVINPATLREMLMTSNVTKLNTGFLSSTTGTGGMNDSGGYDFIRLACPTSAANVVTARYRAINMQKGSSLSANMSFANGVALQFRLSTTSQTGADPNSTGYIGIGESGITTAVLPSLRSIGVQLNHGSNIKILAHDGTTLTTYTTTTSVNSLYLNATDFLLTNDYATGTVTLYINGVSVGSTTGGVTTYAGSFTGRNNFNARTFNQSVPSGSQLGFIIYGGTAIVL